MSDATTNKDLVLRFLRHCFAGDMDEALSLLHPEATWWVLGDPQQLHVSGLRDRGRIERFLKNIRIGFPQGMTVQIEGVTAEGDRVAVEAVSEATMADGQPYRNRYHFLVRLDQGQVIEMREYFDTHYVHQVQQRSAPPRRSA